MTGACTRVLDMIFVTASSDLTGEPLASSGLTGEPLTRTPVSWARDTFIREGNRAPVAKATHARYRGGTPLARA